MKGANRGWLVGLVFWGMAAACQAQPTGESHEEIICKSGGSKRVVRIYVRPPSKGGREPGSCHVDYTRDGKTTTLWTSRTNHAFCTAKALSLVTRLVEDKYTCKPEAQEQPDEAEESVKPPSPNRRRFAGRS